MQRRPLLWRALLFEISEISSYISTASSSSSSTTSNNNDNDNNNNVVLTFVQSILSYDHHYHQQNHYYQSSMIQSSNGNVVIPTRRRIRRNCCIPPPRLLQSLVLYFLLFVLLFQQPELLRQVSFTCFIVAFTITIPKTTSRTHSDCYSYNSNNNRYRKPVASTIHSNYKNIFVNSKLSLLSISSSNVVKPPSTRVVVLLASPNDTVMDDKPDLNSNDPYSILGLQKKRLSMTTINEKELKRIYRKLAMQYHPDITTTRDSTTTEKKVASDQFAKINTAYTTILNQISGKNQHYGTSTSASRSSTSTTTSETGWVPPHRRTRSYTSSSSSSSSSTTTNSEKESSTFSTDWRDYMPKSDTNNDEVYDTNGDSFGKIFSDLLSGVATTVVGAAAGSTSSNSGTSSSGGIFKDFIDFLEQNVDGYGSSTMNNNDDIDLNILLQIGSVQEIYTEMDETELIVQQLQYKLRKVQDELQQLQLDLKRDNIRYSQTIQIQEQMDELLAQQKVVEKYIKMARQRLSKLQVRYKELKMKTTTNSNPNQQQSSSSSSYDSSSSSTNGSNPFRSYDSSTNRNQSSSSSSTTGSGRRTNDSVVDASTTSGTWETEGFGSFGGRSRGSSRRRTNTASSSTQQDEQLGISVSQSSSSSRVTTNTSNSNRTNEPSTTTQKQQPQQGSQSTSTTYTDTKSKTYYNNNNIPPHRRTGKS